MESLSLSHVDGKGQPSGLVEKPRTPPMNISAEQKTSAPLLSYLSHCTCTLIPQLPCWETGIVPLAQLC